MRKEYWRLGRELDNEIHQWFIRLDRDETEPEDNELPVLVGGELPHRAIGILPGPIKVYRGFGYPDVSQALADAIGLPSPFDVTDRVVSAWQSAGYVVERKTYDNGQVYLSVFKPVQRKEEEPIYGGRPASYQRYPSMPPGAKVSVGDNEIFGTPVPIFVFYDIAVDNDTLKATPRFEYIRRDAAERTVQMLNLETLSFDLKDVDVVSMVIDGQRTLILRDECYEGKR